MGIMYAGGDIVTALKVYFCDGSGKSRRHAKNSTSRYCDGALAPLMSAENTQDRTVHIPGFFSGNVMHFQKKEC